MLLPILENRGLGNVDIVIKTYDYWNYDICYGGRNSNVHQGHIQKFKKIVMIPVIAIVAEKKLEFAPM